jgi:hypothetical protein
MMTMNMRCQSYASILPARLGKKKTCALMVLPVAALRQMVYVFIQ